MRIRYSVSNWIFGKEDLEDSFKRLRKLDYDGIELRGEPQLYKISEIKKLMDKYSIEVTSICGMYPGPEPSQLRDLSHPRIVVRKEAMDYVRTNIDFARDLSAPLVIVTPNPVGKIKPLASIKDEWKWAVKSVREIGKYAEEAGILLAIEPINRYETYLINSIEQALDFIDEVNASSVKIMTDTFHMNIEEPNLGEAVRKSGTNLIHVHIADSNRQSAGRGHIHFKEIMGALKEINYTGSLAMESLPPVFNPYLALTEKTPKKLLDNSVEECISLLKIYEKVV